MSRFVNVPNGNYYIKVTDGGEIELNTGVANGKVVVTGDLEVRGTQTVIESTDTSINDNIIILNDGETGSGISLDESGLEIDRGSLENQRFVFDEDVTWLDPNTETLKQGGWHFKDLSGDLTGIRTNSISTGGSDLYLINTGTGVVSVTGTANYEAQVTDDDHIPNKKYVDDYVSTVLATTFQSRIDEGTLTKTFVETHDDEVTGNASYVDIGVNDVPVAQFFANRIELNDIRIAGTKIEAVESNADLILAAPGTGSVRINDQMHINATPSIDDPALEPTTPSDGIKIYSKVEDTGNTGLYFVNSSSTRDEIISNNRSLVYSMLF
jgi:hypothetical protein